MRYEYGNIIIHLIIYIFKVNTKNTSSITQDNKPFKIQCTCISKEEAEKEKKRIAEEEKKKKEEKKETSKKEGTETEKEGEKKVENNEAGKDVGDSNEKTEKGEGTEEGKKKQEGEENERITKKSVKKKKKEDKESKNKFLKITKTYEGSSKESVVSLSDFINAVQNLKFKETCSITCKGWFKVTLLGSKPYNIEVQPFKTLSSKEIQIKDTIQIDFSKNGKLSVKISNKNSFNETVESKIGKEIFEAINGL